MNQGIAASVRLGEVDTVEYQRDRGLGSPSTSGRERAPPARRILRAGAVRDMVEKACSIARYTAVDDCAGLPDAEELAREIPDLDLRSPLGAHPG